MAQPLEKRKYREILQEECTTLENGFVVCSIDESSICNYRQAQGKFDAGNFIRHVRTEHPTLAKIRGLLKEDAEVPVKKRKVSRRMVAIDRQTVIEAVIKLVTVHHAPFSCVEWEGLKLLLDPLCCALNMNMNRARLHQHLTKAANNVRETIKTEVKGKLLCLKIDCATKHGRNILGINIQFFDPERREVIIRTIGMLEILERHTSTVLKVKIEEKLAEYEITLDQIFTVTCDNGSNMIATVKQLQSCITTMHIAIGDDEDEDTNNLDWADAIEREFYNRITLVRCSVHTLQLAVMDVIKFHEANIASCTTVAKNCRKIQYKSVFELHKQPLPPLYSKTRWGGVFQMLEFFCKHEVFFRGLGSQYSDLDLSKQSRLIHEYVATFTPVFEATKNMQSMYTSLSDFYLIWIKTVMEVGKTRENQFTEPLSKALYNRLKQLTESVVFKAALLIDPRFNYLNSSLFSTNEKEEVRKFIVTTWDRLSNIKIQASNSLATPRTIKPLNDQDDSNVSLDAFLTQMFGGSLPEPGTLHVTENTFLRQLSALDFEPRQNHSFDIRKHWIARRDTHPELYEVTMLLLSVPSNQVSVERAFSALALVLTDKRTKLSDDHLENILLIKLNKELLDQIIPNLYSWLEEEL